MPHDPILGSPSADLANAGRVKLNAMHAELDSRLATLEGGASAGRFFMDLDADSPVATTQTQIDSGLQFPVVADVAYGFFALLMVSIQNGNTGRGMRFDITGPGTIAPNTDVDWLVYEAQWPSSSVANWFYRQWHRYDTNLTTALSASGAKMPAMLRGYIKPPASGLVKVRHSSDADTASDGVIVHRGSSLEWWLAV